MCHIEISNAALASTGRHFDLFRSTGVLGAAIIDPNTGVPVSTIEGATVRAPSCMAADALTKIVVIAGTSASELLEHYCASALLVTAGGDVQITPEWYNTVYLAA